MTVRRWIAASLNRKQVDTLVITGAGATSDTITLTIANVDFVITVGGTTTTAGIATTVQQAYSGSTLTDSTASSTIPVADGGASLIPAFSESTATVSGSTVTFTGNGNNPAATAGKPIMMSAAKSGTLTITYTANVTTPTSQFHADQADNWSGNTPPEDGDTVTFDNGSMDMRWNLSTYASGATTSNPTTIVKYKSYTGNVGLPEVNSDNSAKPYHEYRTPTYFTTDAGAATAGTANLEVGEGPGSGRFKWDAGAGQWTVNIFGKGQRSETGVPCVLWKGSHASNVVNNVAGDVGIALFGGETATVATVLSGPSNDAVTYCGSGCSLTTVKVTGGAMTTNSAITTATISAGAWDHFAGTVTTLNLDGGTFRPRAAMTITNCNLRGKIDLSQCTGTVTFTNLVQVYAGAEIYDPNGKATFSAGYKLNCTPDKAKVTRPAGDTHSLS